MGADRLAPVGAILLVGVLGMLGWWMLQDDPTPAPPPAPSAAAPAPAPTAPRHTAAPRVLFRRPAPQPSTEQKPAAAAPKAPLPQHAPTDSPPPVRSMDDLGDRKQDFIEQGLDNLKQVMEACEEHIEGPLQVMARSKLDSRGLVEMTLSTYQLDEGGSFSASDDPIPPAFSDCLDDVLWEQEWYALDPGEEVPFVLTFNLEQPDTVNEP